MTEMRVATADGFDPQKLDEAGKWLADNKGQPLESPDDFKALYDLSTASSQRALASAFDKLPQARKDAVVAHYGVAAESDLSQEQKGYAALHETLTLGDTAMHPTLAGELQSAVTSVTTASTS